MATTKIGTLPRDDDNNGRANTLPERTPNQPLEGDIKPDWIVVGSGFAGLAATRRLAENRPGDKVVLLDAQLVGDGASVR